MAGGEIAEQDKVGGGDAETLGDCLGPLALLCSPVVCGTMPVLLCLFLWIIAKSQLVVNPGTAEEEVGRQGSRSLGEVVQGQCRGLN